MTRIAVIGAGISGLVLARALADSAAVKLFEKSRGYGGRLATRRYPPFQFDHGAQFFTAKADAFRDFLAPWLDMGVIARWAARFVEIDGARIIASRSWADDHPHYVGVPGMSAFGRALGEGLDVSLETRVGEIRRTAAAWQLVDSAGRDLGEFDWVVSAIPAPQAAVLLPDEFEHLDLVTAREMPGCYALMLGFHQALPLEWDAALVKNADISWISVDSSKPGRDGGYSMLVHASNSWAEANMELADDTVIAALSEAASRVTGINLGRADRVALQRWRYANPGLRAGDGALIDAGNRLATIGDWCIRGRVEAACLSGLEAARRLQALL